MVEWDADGIRATVLRLADVAWAERIGSGPFQYADGSHNPFLAKYIEINGPSALADLAARSTNPVLRKKWLRAIRLPRKRDAKGRFASTKRRENGCGVQTRGMDGSR